MANIDQNYDGSTKLRDWYPKVKSNFSAINTQVDEIATNAALIQNSDGGFSAGNNAEAETGGAVGASAGTLLGGSVGNNAHSSSGGAVGYAAITTTGGAVGQGTHSEDGGVMGYWAQAKSGGAIGAEAEADTGGAVGRKAWTGNGGAVGYLAYAANGGGSVGSNANSDAGGAVGANAKAGAGFAGGSDAKAVDSDDNGIDAIQLGTGANSTPKTLQVYGYQLMDANGNIPIERLSNVPQAVEEIEVTTNDIFMADELDHFTCGMEESRTAVIRQHFVDETTGSGTAYGTAMFITVESNTPTNNGQQDGHPVLTQTLYYSPDLIYTRKGTNKNDGSMLYEWEYWTLEKKFVSDAPSDDGTYGRKNGDWEELTDLHTHANKAILDATEVAYTESDQARISTLENDLDTFYTDLNDLQNTALSDAPSDGNTYARKDGAWTNLTRQIGKQLINFVPLEYDSSDVTDLDNLPSGITIVDYADGPGYGGYMVMTSLEGSGYGYQIKISIEGLSYRYNNGTWGSWIKIG